MKGLKSSSLFTFDSPPYIENSVVIIATSTGRAELFRVVRVGQQKFLKKNGFRFRLLDIGRSLCDRLGKGDSWEEVFPQLICLAELTNKQLSEIFGVTSLRTHRCSFNESAWQRQSGDSRTFTGSCGTQQNGCILVRMLKFRRVASDVRMCGFHKHCALSTQPNPHVGASWPLSRKSLSMYHCRTQANLSPFIIHFVGNYRAHRPLHFACFLSGSRINNVISSFLSRIVSTFRHRLPMSSSKNVEKKRSQFTKGKRLDGRCLNILASFTKTVLRVRLSPLWRCSAAAAVGRDEASRLRRVERGTGTTRRIWLFLELVKLFPQTAKQTCTCFEK